MAKKESSMARKKLGLLQAYRDVFMGPHGQMVLLDLMDAHGMMRNAYNGNVNDMLIKEGERLVVLRILHKLNLNIKDLKERIEDYERQQSE